VEGLALHKKTNPTLTVTVPTSPGAGVSRPRGTPPYGQPPVVALPLAYPDREQVPLTAQSKLKRAV